MFFDKLQANPILLNFFYGLVTIFLINFIIKFVKRVRKLPPGPWGLPFVGYLPFIRPDAYNHMTELAAKYGPVFSIKCGQFDLIVISQWKLVKEALANDYLLGRPEGTFIPGVIEHASFLEMSGEPWKEQRRVALATLRDVGLGKSESEDSVRDEIGSFIEVIKSFEGKPISIPHRLSLSITNNISNLVFGHKYDYDDPVALDMESLFFKSNELINFFNVPTFLPKIASLIIKLNLFDLSESKSLLEKFESHIINEVKEHRKKDIDDNEIRDYIDGFLNEMAKRQNEKDSVFNLITLQRNAALFYIAGSDTISNTLKWSMLYLCKYPEYQDKIRAEIKQTIGFNRQPDNVDRQKMPLTMAFIYEALRFSSIFPLNLLRRATEDTEVGGYLIPKDSYVTFNFWSIHHDPNLWDNPELFRPERFLNDDKSKAIKPPYLIAFSGGKRACPGESFAYLQLFLYIVSILQQFEISTESGKDVTLERIQHFVMKPKHIPNFIFRRID